MATMTVRDYYIKFKPYVLELTWDEDELISQDTSRLLQLTGSQEGHPMDPNGTPLFDVPLLDVTIGSLADF